MVVTSNCQNLAPQLQLLQHRAPAQEQFKNSSLSNSKAVYFKNKNATYIFRGFFEIFKKVLQNYWKDN